MKKRILLAIAMVVLFVCLFAVSVSAAEPAYNDGEWIYAADGTTKLAIRDTDGNPLIWYMNGEELKWVRADQTDETQSVYVKYLISAGGSGFDAAHTPTKCLQDIDIYDNGTQIECSSINSALVLFNMEKLDVDAINGWLWGNKNGCCTKMLGIVFPSTLKYIGQEGFTNHKIVQMWNLENTQFEWYNTFSQEPFSNKYLTQEATNYTIKFPSTLTMNPSISGTKVKVAIFSPNSTVGNANQTLRDCSKLEKVYFHTGFVETSFNGEGFRGTTGFIMFFTGTEEQAATLKENSANSWGHNDHFKDDRTQIISYETYLADQETYDSANQKIYIVCNYNFCDAFYDGNHTENDNPCVINCDRCDDYDGQMKKNPQHNYVDSIAYSNYLANGTKTQTCQSAGCEHNTTPNVVEVAPIIADFKGFAVNYDGDGITFGYVIDYDALDEFVKVTGKNVELGFVAAVKAFAGDDAYTSDKAIKANVVKWTTNDEENDETVKYTAADFVLRGNWDKQVDLDGDEVAETDVKKVEFYMAGCMIVNGNVVYLNSSGSSANAGVITFEDCDQSEIVE